MACPIITLRWAYSDSASEQTRLVTGRWSPEAGGMEAGATVRAVNPLRMTLLWQVPRHCAFVKTHRLCNTPSELWPFANHTSVLARHL